MVLGSSPVAITSSSDLAPVSSKEFLDIQATIECGFTLKRVRDMTRTYSQCMTRLRPSHKFLRCLVDCLSSKRCSKYTVGPWGGTYLGTRRCFAEFRRIQYQAPNGVCYFDLFAISRKIFSILKILMSKYMHGVVAYEPIVYGSILRCILQLHGFQTYGYLKLS